MSRGAPGDGGELAYLRRERPAPASKKESAEQIAAWLLLRWLAWCVTHTIALAAQARLS